MQDTHITRRYMLTTPYPVPRRPISYCAPDPSNLPTHESLRITPGATSVHVVCNLVDYSDCTPCKLLYSELVLYVGLFCVLTPRFPSRLSLRHVDCPEWTHCLMTCTMINSIASFATRRSILV